MIKIYHNNMCSKSRAALEVIKEKNEEVDVQDYLVNTPSKEVLTELLGMLKMAPLDLIRKNENIFKELYSNITLTDEQWVEVMVKHPVLIQRPILVKDGKAVIGRSIDAISELI